MTQLPPAEVDVTPELVRQLLEQQHPDLARLPLRTLAHGWDNEMLRLGDDLLVRLPRRQLAAELVEHEQRWLPRLAPSLPVAVPDPVRVGRPGAGYPWSWSVLPVLPGEVVASVPVPHRRGMAAGLGRVLAALHVEADDDVWASPFRGGSLAPRDEEVRMRLAARGGAAGTEALVAYWEEALAATIPRPQLWVHGDPHPLNMLTDGVALTALIDWGDVCAGDPACDLATAWLTFDADGRASLRGAYDAAATHGLDLDALWARARGWAIRLGTMLAGLQGGSPALVAVGEHTVAELVAG